MTWGRGEALKISSGCNTASGSACTPAKKVDIRVMTNCAKWPVTAAQMTKVRAWGRCGLCTDLMQFLSFANTTLRDSTSRCKQTQRIAEMEASMGEQRHLCHLKGMEASDNCQVVPEQHICLNNTSWNKWLHLSLNTSARWRVFPAPLAFFSSSNNSQWLEHFCGLLRKRSEHNIK